MSKMHEVEIIKKELKDGSKESLPLILHPEDLMEMAGANGWKNYLSIILILSGSILMFLFCKDILYIISYSIYHLFIICFFTVHKCITLKTLELV